MTYLDFKIYDYNKYQSILSTYSCYNNFYDNKNSKVSNKFMNDLLTLSKNRCFMCGYSLETNNERGIYAEREHVINKVTDKNKNLALNKCKKNIVPICRTCNGKKTMVTIPDDLKNELKNLEHLCDYNNIKQCNFDNCLTLFKTTNFDFNASSKNYKYNIDSILFDVITKVYLGNVEYINEFDLNYRTYNIFDNIFKLMYESDFTGHPEFKENIQMFSQSILDDNLIAWLEINNILNDKVKTDDLIETITLLELL